MDIEDVTTEEIVVAINDQHRNWTPNLEANVLWTRSVLNHLHAMLDARGHLFVNEALDLLGFPRTQAGAVLGWTRHSRIIAEFSTVSGKDKVVIRLLPEDIIWNKI